MAENILFRPEEPIINTMLEVDVYKILMLVFIMRYFENLDVEFAFKNRTVSVPLAKHVDIGELREQLAHVRTLSFEEDEIAHLRSWGIFPEWFLKRLKHLRLPEPVIEKTKDDQLSITATGKWCEVTLWETIILTITNELYSRSQIGLDLTSQKVAFVEADKLLSRKIEFLNEKPLTFAQFGLRRRASGLWERHVSKRLLGETHGAMLGISNVQVARELGVEALGTKAHELSMALYALRRHESDVAVRNSPFEVLDLWQRIYGQKLLIVLPDTFGSDFMLNNMTHEQALDWKGFRQDSGDPVQFGEKVISMYKRFGIDPSNKLLIFSDGLRIERMFELYQHFYGRIIVSFGWGTNLTNDFSTHKALSLVMKLVRAAGRPAVKLSDNLLKAVGDKEEIEAAKRIFGYTNQFSEQPIY